MSWLLLAVAVAVMVMVVEAVALEDLELAHFLYH
jgi:hypothetical protein